EKLSMIKGLSNDPLLKDIGLRRISVVPKALEFLPEILIRDATGNFEIILPPLGSFGEWMAKTNTIAESFGVGSMQGTIGMPKAQALKLFSKEELLGLLNFIHIYDSVQKLKSGYDKSLSNPTLESAKSFVHPFLSPINKIKFEKMKYFINQIYNNKVLSEEALHEIAKSDASFKYIGSTAFRPDLSKDHFVFEVRDAHKDTEKLNLTLTRMQSLLAVNLNLFHRAANLPAFDSMNTYDLFPPNIKSMLESTFPSKADPRVSYTKEELQVLEVYRNFAWPLREWSSALEFIDATRLAETVSKAQRNYIFKLNQWSMVYAQKTPSENSVALQKILVDFIHESNLSKAFEEKMKSLLEELTTTQTQSNAA
ncbi:MAG: hypothetical protein V4596_00850, partial [Bdellovibrionota bacterium]